MGSLRIAWKRVEPTVNDRSAPVVRNRTLYFPDVRGGPLSECGIEESPTKSLMMLVGSLERPPGGACGQGEYWIYLGDSRRKAYGSTHVKLEGLGAA